MSSWQNIPAGVPQSSVLGPLLFLIYINDLPDGLTSISKIFADDTSLFSGKWAFKQKSSFNPDPNKQAREVCFSNNRDKEKYPPLQSNNTDVQMADSQKHLGLILDSKLNFNEHTESKITKCNKIIGSTKNFI